MVKNMIEEYRPVTWMTKEVGQLRADKKVFKTVRLPIHIYHKERSIGISKEVLNKIDNISDFNLLKIVFILKLGNNRVYELNVNYDYFKKHSFVINNPDLDMDAQMHMKISELCEVNMMEDIKDIPKLFMNEEKYHD